MGLDEAYADLTGVPKPLRVLRELIDEVHEQTGIQISAGVGPNRLIAKCCSDLGKPAGFVAMGREEACIRFATAPTRRLPGIGPKTAERLAELGYATVAQLQEADEAQLAARFGDRTARYLKARAQLPRRLARWRRSPAPRSRSRPSAPSTRTSPSHEELETILRTLSRELCEGLARKDRQGRTVAIKVRLADWTTVTRARTLPDATHDTALVTETALELLRAYAPAQPVRLLGVRLAAFDDLEPDKPPAPAAPVGQLRLRRSSTGRWRACGARRARAGAPTPSASRTPTTTRRSSSLRSSSPAAMASISASRPASVSPASSAANAACELRVVAQAQPRRPGRRRRRSRRRWPGPRSAPSRSPAAASSCAQRDGGVGAAGLELQRALAGPPREPDADERVGLGGDDAVEEALDLRRRQRADELVDDLAVLERLDGRDRLDPEGLREARVGVGVDLDERDLAGALVDGLLDHGPERAARAAPLGPEVDDHGLLVGALDDVALEGLFSRFDGHAARIERHGFSDRRGRRDAGRRGGRDRVARSCCCTG